MNRHSAAPARAGYAFRAVFFVGAFVLAAVCRAQDSFESDDTAATAKSIGNGETQNRSLHVGDVDWVKITIGPGGATSLRVETGSVTGTAGDTEMWLYDSRDLTKEIAYNNDTTNSRFSLITLGSVAAGTYYVRVGGTGSETGGAYALRALWSDRPDSFETDDTAAAAKRIANGERQERSIHVANDVDWASFTIGSSGASNVRIETSGTVGDTEMWLYGPNSATAQLGYSDDAAGGKFSVVTLDSLAEGTYFIQVRAFGLGSSISSYVLQASWTQRGDSFEADDTPATAKPIANGQTQNRTLHVAGDVDWVTFTIGPNGATNARVETTGPSGGDTELWLYGPNSPTALVAYNDDAAGGKFSLITAGSLAAGTYYARVAEFGNDAGIGAYNLRVSWSDAPAPAPGDALEPDDVAANARAIGNGGAQQRSIHRDADVDWAQFTIGPNGAFNVKLETLGNGGDTEMWLYGPNSTTTELSYNDDGGSGKFAAIALNTLSAGTYFVKVNSYRQASTIPAYTLRASWVDGVVAPAATRLVNLSIRTAAGGGSQTVIVGFVLSGAGAKPLLLRGVGPTLGSFGVTGALADPSLQLYGGTTLLASNDNWGGDAGIRNAAAAVSAFPLPEASRDAALLQVFEAGNYSVQITGGNGIALVEAYEVGASGLPRLSNISARAQVGTGADVLIAGFVIAGPSPKTVLIRAVGPSLSQFGVTGVLADPRLDVYRGTTLLESNDNWGGAANLTAAFAQVGAFTLAGTSRDSALVLTLQPGAYSAQISGVGGTAGTALVEVYEIP